MIWTVFLLYGEIGELAFWRPEIQFCRSPGGEALSVDVEAAFQPRLFLHQRLASFPSPTTLVPCQSFHDRHCRALVYGLRFHLNRFFATCPITCSRQLHRLSPSLSPCADGNRFRGYIQTGWRSCVLPELHRFRGYSLLR